MRKLAFVLVAWLSVVGLMACSSDLSRAEAKELIAAHYKYPMHVSAELEVGENIRVVNKTKWLESLQREGLINYRHIRWFGVTQMVSVSLTQKGMKYVVGDGQPRRNPNNGLSFFEVKLGERLLVDVTGIVRAKGENQALVEYLWAFDGATPFAKDFAGDEVYIDPMSPMANVGKPQMARAMIVLYDDGWRVSEDGGKLPSIFGPPNYWN